MTKVTCLPLNAQKLSTLFDSEGAGAKPPSSLTQAMTLLILCGAAVPMSRRPKCILAPTMKEEAKKP